MATMLLVSAACSDDTAADTGGADDAGADSTADAAPGDGPSGGPGDAGGSAAGEADAAGAGDASADPATGVDGGGPDAGDADSPDAPPPQIDRTHLVPTSGSHLLFSRIRPGQSFATELVALDLEDGTLHDMNPEGHLVIYTSVSPNGESFLFSTANAAAEENLWLVRLLHDGAVPASLVAGFEGRPANHYDRGWSADSRFAIYYRGSNLIPDGVDVIDSWANAVHWSADSPADDSYGFAYPSPAGMWFGYALGQDTRIVRLGHITATEVDVHELPAGAGAPAFALDSSRAVISVYDEATDSRSLFVQELPGQPVEVDTDAGGPSFAYQRGFTADGQHVLAAYQSAPGFYELRRIDLRGGSAPSLVSDPTRSQSGGPGTADLSLMLLNYRSESSQELELVHLDGSRPAVPIATLPPDTDVQLRMGAVGASGLYYNVGDAELHVLALDAASQVVDTVVSESGETGFQCLSSIFWSPPPGKLIFQDITSFSLVMVDVSQPAAARVGVLAPTAGARLTCPVWHVEGGAFVFAEIGDTESRIYRVEWADSTPSAPELLHEAEGELRPQILGP